MVSTARDQAVWLRALVAGDVLDPAHLKLLQNPHRFRPRTTAPPTARRGLLRCSSARARGLATWNVPGIGHCLGHAGSIPGANGIAAYCPDQDLAIVILNNANPATTTPGYPGLVELAPVALQAVAG